MKHYNYLGGGFEFFNFHPYLGKISNLTNIFQMGWNHQPVIEFTPGKNPMNVYILAPFFL